MKMRDLLKLFTSVFAAGLLLTSHIAIAEPTLPELYQTIESGHFKKFMRILITL